MIRIVAASHYFHRLHASDSLPSLDEQVAAVCRERHRRTDRFVQLALIGAARCVAGRELAPDCGLYLSSGVGPIGSNVLVQDAIHCDRKLPMPFNFVNALGSSACHLVAKDLHLTGEGVLLARSGGSFTAALACAIADLASNVTSQLLVGAVEEGLVPASRYRALLRLNDDVAVAEGSHWLLLERTERTAIGAVDLRSHRASYQDYESGDAATLTGYLNEQSGDASFGLTWEGTGQATLVQHT